jgi:hypothetical protein
MVPRALAAAASSVIAFIGLCHEAVGAVVYPFGPALFGGPVGWHMFGVLTVIVGILLLIGVLEWVRIPVMFLSLFVGVVGLALTLLVGIVFERFHFFATSAVLMAITVAISYRAARSHAHG